MCLFVSVDAFSIYREPITLLQSDLLSKSLCLASHLLGLKLLQQTLVNFFLSGN